ncbi:hypothetical protein AAFC00_005623 [Neodothiora populina]|uniref:U1-type domain-containing protein n=1 Tax=Neodothiora populina TaxID=2781224 RepID=A0ABR3PLI3_9PEZI
MSEYWKSTPKYWCKFCSTFVRDTNLERKSHEATPKHQSGIQRSLRNLHKNTEREERDKERARAEVARLNGLVGGNAGSSSSSSSSAAQPGSKPTTTTRSATGAAAAPPPKASIEERKRQMGQLAAMGIAVPEAYRKEMAVGGEWTTVSETPIYHKPAIIKSEDDDDLDSKESTAFGVKKRKLDEDELEAEEVARKGWGSKFKTYPNKKAKEEDLDALLSGALNKKPAIKSEDMSDAIKQEDNITSDPTPNVTGDSVAALKKEEPSGESALDAVPDINQASDPLKQQAEASEPPVVFKKRKGKR